MKSKIIWVNSNMIGWMKIQITKKWSWEQHLRITRSTWQYRSCSCSSICCWQDKYSSSSGLAYFFLITKSTHNVHKLTTDFYKCIRFDACHRFNNSTLRWLSLQPAKSVVLAKPIHLQGRPLNNINMVTPWPGSSTLKLNLFILFLHRLSLNPPALK